MPLNIKNEEAHRLAKALAEKTGHSLTETVLSALREAIARETMKDEVMKTEKVKDLNVIADKMTALPIVDSRTSHEIIGYDELGLPR